MNTRTESITVRWSWERRLCIQTPIRPSAQTLTVHKRVERRYGELTPNCSKSVSASGVTEPAEATTGGTKHANSD